MHRLLACLFLPDAVACEIRGVQQRVAGYRPLLPPHVTLAPPVDGGFPREALRAACRSIGPLEFTVGPAGSFDTAERVAFLEVGGPGRDALAVLHRTLTGRAAGFVPHVTLVRGLSRDLFDAVLAAARDLRWTEVRIGAVHVVAMTRAEGGPWSWRPEETVPLTTVP